MRLPRFRFTVRRLLVVVAMMTVSMLVILWKPFIISYHERKMATDWTTVERIGASDPHQGDFIRSMENHRDALVRLGYLKRHVFYLKHVRVSSNESKPLYLALNRRAAGLPVFEMYGWNKTPDSVIVWAKPGEMDSWESIVEKFDRLDSGSH